MAWDLEADRPIYAQLVERIQMQIVSGQYPPGTRLPSVRELAATAAVNPHTMQKAFAELERGGLILTQRTNGRSVTDDEELIRQVRSGLAKEHLDHFFLKMQELGFTRGETVELLKESAGRAPAGIERPGTGEEPEGTVKPEEMGSPKEREQGVEQ